MKDSLSNQGLVVFAVTFVLAAVPIAGCGGDEGSSANGGTTKNASGSTGDSAGGAETESEGGSRGGSGSAGGEEVSAEKAKFIKQAEGICNRITAEVFARAGSYADSRVRKGANEKEVLAEVIPKFFLPKFEEQVEEIRALSVPDGDEDEVEAYLAASEAAIEESGSRQYTAATLRRFGTEFEEPRELGRAYGIDSCVFYEA